MLNESMWFAFGAGVAAKSTVVLGIAWLITLVLRRQSAGARHLVWTAGAAAVLALPFFSLWMPAVRVPSVATFAPGAAAFFETTAAMRTDAAAMRVDQRSGVTATERPIEKRLDWRLIQIGRASCRERV